MKDKQAKYPQLRFKGFTDPWVQRNLGDLAEIVRGASPRPIQDPKWFDDSSEIGWLRISDVTEQNGRIHHLDQHISEAGQAKTRVLTEPHLLLSIAATVGKPLVNYVKTGVHDGFLIFMNPKFDLEFMFQWLESYRDKWSRYGQPGSQVNLNSDLVKNQSISIPSMDEQQKLGEFFTSIDNLIAANQRKLDLLKEQKKGYLQKMFPKNGAKVPELRFAGFADDWEQRKLGEEAQLTMGQAPNSENYTKNPDDYILVQGNADMKNGRVVPRVWTTQITKKAEKSDLILSVRAPVGDIGKTDYDVVLGRGVAAIKGNEFIFQQLGKMKLTGYWTRYSTGSTFESINSNDIKDAKIMVPVEEEQQKIGAFFKQLDDTIVLHQRKLDLLKEQKKGFLQKMFV
ncbi:restriction endonuclease subunit S [Secundilactobacillus paracollinoides]|uniref:Restriction endonuclease subunit S n=1 Tax=Secundilactobacillus paracollinoides TaxID=240427 RepID=A0A1B2J341_9LACO|nr:restriction endonuclease subunit S [Secundilactobacillus paracollinoides]ANZ68716.1 restriction endonuclease subunit S [Secundilactobacillus paracollinoides]